MKNIRYMGKVVSVAFLFVVMMGLGFGHDRSQEAKTETVLAGTGQELGIRKYEVTAQTNTVVRLLSDNDEEIGRVVGEYIGSTYHLGIQLQQLAVVVDVYAAGREISLVANDEERARVAFDDEGSMTVVMASDLTDLPIPITTLSKVLADGSVRRALFNAPSSGSTQVVLAFDLLGYIVSQAPYAVCYYGCVASTGQWEYCGPACRSALGS